MGHVLGGIRDAIEGLDGRGGHGPRAVRPVGLPLIDLQRGTVTRADGALDAYYSNAFRACLLAKARPLSTLPVDVYERRGGVRERDESPAAAALSGLLRNRWNPLLTGAEGVRWMVMTKDTMGNAFARVEYDAAGRPRAIWPWSLTPEVLLDASGRAAFRYPGDKFTPQGTYLGHEVIWVKSPVVDSDGLMGLSLAQLAARELGLSIDLEDFYARLMRNGNHFPGYLETDARLQQADVDRIKQELADGAGILGAGKVRIFDNGIKYRQSQLTMADMSLVDQERWVLQQTCRTLSVPPQEVFELSNATYSNIEQGARNFANKTLVTEAVTLEQAFNEVLRTVGRPDSYVRFNMDGLLRGDYESRMNGYRTAIFSRQMTPNEARAKEEEPPYEGGDLVSVPSAYALMDPRTGEIVHEASSAAATGGSGEGDDPSLPSGSGRPSLAALEPVHADMEERVRRRVREAGDGPRARDFAARVLAPYAAACAAAGVPYDIEADIERMAANA